jgi:hypothetical protein
MVMLPKLMLEGATANCPATVPVPVPVNATETAGFEASDVMVRLPVALPTDCGANETGNVMLCAGFRVSGGVIPLKANPVPAEMICEIVNADPPELESVSVREALLLVAMLPKLRLAGAAVS